MKKVVDKEKAIHLFREIQTEFPKLEMKLNLNDPHVDLSMDIPMQNDLKFKVNLNLQGDELHLCAGKYFWVEWFPSTDDKVVRSYREAVCGLLSGSFRIVEYYRGKRAVSGRLQRPDGGEWKTVTGWSNLWNLLPGGRTSKVLGSQ